MAAKLNNWSSREYTMPDQCPFCQLLENPERTIRIHETDNFIAFIDINPGAKGQTIIASKDHYDGLEDIPKKLIGEAFEAAHAVSEKAINGLGADGISISLNSGEAAGQRIPHFFIKVFPRYESDEQSGVPVGAIFKPMDMEKEELAKIGKKMKGASFSKKDKGSSAGFVGPSHNVEDNTESVENESSPDSEDSEKESESKESEEKSYEKDQGSYPRDSAEFV